MNERSIFLTALEIADQERRAAYLAAACGGDERLQQSVQELLAQSPGESFLNTPAAAFDSADTQPASGAHVALEFLAPSEAPGALGRLGTYEIMRVIGHGGMGIVLEGRDTRLQRIVAVKVLAPQLAASAAARQRFLREARAAAAVRDEHVVTIHAVEEAAEIPYLVMELIAGTSLQERIEKGGPLEIKEILRIGIQAARGLAAAHGQGLIHRDIKPANILLENGVERVKITDFGLARVADDASISQSGLVAGTPQYMAPEQARGEMVDHRADLFSLGSVLYAMCTGRPPFRASTTLGVLKRVCEDPLSPIREANPNIPEWLVAVIDKLHAKDPDARYQSAVEVAELLSQHLAQLQHPALVEVIEKNLSRSQIPNPKFQIGLRRWAIAAAAVLLLVGISLTEATGVTQIAATVIRILTPEGTLVVELNEPGVKVTIEGDGGLVITGAGLHEVRLKPGNYQLRATKNGQPAHTEIVTILKGQRKVVTVKLEPKGPPLAPGEGREFTGHTGTVWSVAITRDGRQVVSGSQDRTARVWDTATGQEVSRFEGHESCVYCVAVSPDGRRVLSGCGPKPETPEQSDARKGSIAFWELATGKELKRLDGLADSITSIALSGDGSRALVGGYSGNVLLWDVDGWREIKRIATAPRLWSVGFSPDESRLVTASGYALTSDGKIEKGCIQLWNLSDGQELQRMEGHEQGVWKAVFSPSGNQIATAGNDRTIRLWNTRTGAPEYRFTTRDVTTGVAYSQGGKYLLAGTYGLGPTVWLWNVQTRKVIQSFAGHTNGVQSVAISRDGRWAVSGSHDRTVRLWALPAEVHQDVSPSGQGAAAAQPRAFTAGQAEKASSKSAPPSDERSEP
jgi:serine/threonine protein kinase/WD40 repeat protein